MNFRYAFLFLAASQCGSALLGADIVKSTQATAGLASSSKPGPSQPHLEKDASGCELQDAGIIPLKVMLAEEVEKRANDFHCKDGLRRFISSFDGSYAINWACLYKNTVNNQSEDLLLTEKNLFFKVRSHLNGDEDRRLDRETYPANDCVVLVDDDMEFYQLRFHQPGLNRFASRLLIGWPAFVMGVVFEIESWLRHEREKQEGDLTVCACEIRDDVLLMYFGTTVGSIFFVGTDDKFENLSPKKVSRGPLEEDKTPICDLELGRNSDDSLDFQRLFFVTEKTLGELSSLSPSVSSDGVSDFAQPDITEEKCRKLCTVDTGISFIAVAEKNSIFLIAEGRRLRMLDDASGAIQELQYNLPAFIDSVAWLNFSRPEEPKQLVVCSNRGMQIYFKPQQHVEQLLSEFSNNPGVLSLLDRYMLMCVRNKFCAENDALMLFDLASSSEDCDSERGSLRRSSSFPTTSIGSSMRSIMSKVSNSSSLMSYLSRISSSSSTANISLGSLENAESTTMAGTSHSRLSLNSGSFASINSIDHASQLPVQKEIAKGICLKELLSASDETGATILHRAAAAGYSKFVRALIGRDVLSKELLYNLLMMRVTNDDRTVLHEAVLGGDPEIVSCMLREEFGSKLLNELKTLGDKDKQNLAKYALRISSSERGSEVLSLVL